MKKYLSILLCIILMIFLFSCEKDVKTESTPFSTEKPLPTEQTTSSKSTDSQMTVTLPTPIPTVPSTSLSEAAFYYADLVDYSEIMKSYNGFYVTGHRTTGQNSSHVAMRILSYSQLQNFLKDAPSAEAAQVLKTYEKSFFEENALLLILFHQSTSTAYSLKNISHGAYGNPSYMIELDFSHPLYSLTDEIMIPADLTCKMLLIPDKKHHIEQANADILITVSPIKEESGNFISQTTITDVCPNDQQNAFYRIAYTHHETLLNDYAPQEIETNFDSGKAKLLRFEDYESYHKWQKEALLALEGKALYGIDEAVFAAASRYDKMFFEKNMLNIIIFNRSSGSYNHKNAVAYLCQNGKIIVRMTANTPELMTADMASWLLFLPQSGEYENGEFDRILVDFE